MMRNTRSVSMVCAALVAFAVGSPLRADEPKVVEIPGDTAFPESLSAGPDGTLYVGSITMGGVVRVKPGSTKAEPWITPGAFGTRSTFGIYVDAKTNTLWVCSNDASMFNIPGPSTTKGMFIKAFDLTSGEGKASYQLPGEGGIINDIVIADDGTLYATNILLQQILRLKPGAKDLEVVFQDKSLQPEGPGFDGIAVGGDGNIYFDTYGGGQIYRLDIKNGEVGKVTKLEISRALKAADAFRLENGLTFLMVEGGGSLNRVTVEGDKAKIETVKDGLNEPTSFIVSGNTAWITEGQFSHLFDAKTNGPPSLPFKIVPAPVGK